MNELNLTKLYNKADTKKLVSMFSKSMAYEKQALVLNEKAESITKHVENTVRERLEKINDVSSDNAYTQLQELSKQWSIMSASIVKVKRSISLDGFHSNMTLWINPEYGIKEYKRCVRYSPFSSNEFEVKLSKTKTFYFMNGKLFINDSQDEGYINFVTLTKIPQIDQDKISQFIEITKDIVYMIDSWRNFFGAKDKNRVSMFQKIKDMSEKYKNHDPKKYLKQLTQLDKMILFKKKLSVGMIKQEARWELVIQKWKAVNKNFLILNELRNSELKI